MTALHMHFTSYVSDRKYTDIQHDDVCIRGVPVLKYVVHTEKCDEYSYSGFFDDDLSVFSRHCTLSDDAWVKYSTSAEEFFMKMFCANHCVSLLSDVILLFEYVTARGMRIRCRDRTVVGVHMRECVVRSRKTVGSMWTDDGYVESHPKPTVLNATRESEERYIKPVDPRFRTAGPHEYAHFVLELECDDMTTILVDLLPSSMQNTKVYTINKKRVLHYRVLRMNVLDEEYIHIGEYRQRMPQKASDGSSWSARAPVVKLAGDLLIESFSCLCLPY